MTAGSLDPKAAASARQSLVQILTAHPAVLSNLLANHCPG